MKVLNRFIVLITIISIAGLSSCKIDKFKNPTEPVKDISGSWKVIKIIRNGTDITGFGYDFTQFRVVFNKGTYTLQNRIPFVVDANGTYSLNSPQYPTLLTFSPMGGSAVTAAFIYPISTTAGVRNILLTFTANPTCLNNSYIYTLQQAN